MSSSRENEPFEKVESVCRELIASLKVKNTMDEIIAHKLMYIPNDDTQITPSVD